MNRMELKYYDKKGNIHFMVVDDLTKIIEFRFSTNHNTEFELKKIIGDEES